MSTNLCRMTVRERWLAALRLQPVDRLPCWPKLNEGYHRAQSTPFSAMTFEELETWIGSDRHAWVPAAITERRGKTALEIVSEEGVRRLRYVTPAGTLQAIHHWDASSQSWHPVEFPIKRGEDLSIMTAWYEDARLDLDHDALADARTETARLGEEALVFTCLGESPLMHFVEWLAGVENAHLLLADYPEEAEGLFDAAHRYLLRTTEIALAHSPAELFYFIENTSTTLISPAQYRRYCLPYLQEYARLGVATGRLLGLHMCGHLKALLPDLARIPVAAFEAFTSPPLGNTTLLDGRTACPDVCLIGGSNAVLWMQSAREIIAQLEADLDALPHHRGLVITCGGVMPFRCPPETIREVCTWVRRYPARL